MRHYVIIVLFLAGIIIICSGVFTIDTVVYAAQKETQNVISEDNQLPDVDKNNLPNFHKVNDMLYRGGRPKPASIGQLREIGIKTVLSFECAFFFKNPDAVQKEKQWVEKTGLKFLHIPMHPLFRPSVKDVRKALDFIATPENQPIFIHCERGSDRTGIVIAAYRISIQGWDIKDALSEMKKYGHRSILLFWWKNILSTFKQNTMESACFENTDFWLSQDNFRLESG